MRTRWRGVPVPSLRAVQRTIRAPDRKGRYRESAWNAACAPAALDQPLPPRQCAAHRSPIYRLRLPGPTPGLSPAQDFDKEHRESTSISQSQNTCDAGKNSQRKIDIDILEVVLS